MTYTPEITEVIVTDINGDSVATIKWIDEASLQVIASSIVTNSQDWPNISVAIQAGIASMEQSTRQAQARRAGE